MSRARSGRSTSAQSARSSIDDRTAAPNPSLRMMLAVCHIVLTASRPPDSKDVAGIDPAAQLVGLPTGSVELDGHHHDHDGLDRGNAREDVGAISHSRSPFKYWMLVP